MGFNHLWCVDGGYGIIIFNSGTHDCNESDKYNSSYVGAVLGLKKENTLLFKIIWISRSIFFKRVIFSQRGESESGSALVRTVETGIQAMVKLTNCPY